MEGHLTQVSYVLNPHKSLNPSSNQTMLNEPGRNFCWSPTIRRLNLILVLSPPRVGLRRSIYIKYIAI